MCSHGIGISNVYHSVWGIKDAINLCPKLEIKFPSCYGKQNEIAGKLKLKSTIVFDNCVGCTDGVLIWTSKPSIIFLLRAKLRFKNFYCGRKNVLF